MAANEKGQTLLELVMLMPILFGFSVLLYKVNMVSQVAINNTQYARSQIYVLTKNSSEYPRLEFRYSGKMFASSNQDRMVLGVADVGSGQNDTVEPIPVKVSIARSASTAKGSSEAGENIKKRTKVRVRNTSAICTQLNKVPGTSNQRWPFSLPVCRYEGMI